MSVAAQTRSSSRAASMASRISGAATDAPSRAPSVSTSERNPITSVSLATPARVTSWSPARSAVHCPAFPAPRRIQLRPSKPASRIRFAKRCSSGFHSSSTSAAGT